MVCVPSLVGGAGISAGLDSAGDEAVGISINANEVFIKKQGFVSKVHRKKPHLKPMLRHVQRSNAGKSVVRSCIERVVADQKAQTELFVRTMGIIRANMRIGLANIVYNVRRFLFLERISAPI